MSKVFKVILGLSILVGYGFSASPPGEPGDDMAHAVLIQPGTYTETLDSTDRHDFYKFKVQPKESVTLILTPSGSNDFDLALYDCKGYNIANSENGAGKRDMVYGIVKDSSCEYWYADAFEYSGKGEYYLELKIDTIKPVWTLMVFVNGDNNLESFAYQDVNEMEAANPSPYINVVVQFDTKSGSTYRYLIHGDNDQNNITSPIVDRPGEQNMGDGNTLVNFVKWAVQKYPAKKYGLILWDHGSGWHKGVTSVYGPLKGVSQDESSGYDMIEVSSGELGRALSSIKSIIGKKLDFLGFDACLMGMWEVLDVIKDYADYATVSEQTEGAQGWYYTGFVGMGPNTSGAALATSIVNSQQGLSTLAAINLSAIDRVTQAVNDLAQALINARPRYSTAIDNARAHFYEDGSGSYDHEYGWDARELPNYHEDIDLYRFAYYIANDTTLPSQVRQYANDVMSAVSGAVMGISTASDYREDSHGISIYYPKDPRNYNHSVFGGDYDKLPVARKTKWDEFIKGEQGGASYDYTLTNTSYNWIDTRDATGVTGDDQSKQLSLPFTFKFYGVDYNSVYVCSNGFLSFTSNSSAYRPQSLPNSGEPNAVIAPFWRDLNPSAAGNITYYAGRDKFVITWDGVKNYENNSRETFQVILYPNGEIVFQYKDITNDATTTIGLENESGTSGKEASSPRNGVAYRWVPTSKNTLSSSNNIANTFNARFSGGVLNIEFASVPSTTISVNIYNVAGRRIKSGTFTPSMNVNIPLGTLPRGVYIARVAADREVHTVKFYVVR